MNSRSRRKVSKELRAALEKCWFLNDTEKNKSVELIKQHFPRAKFSIKTSWQEIEKDIITFDKVKEIIKNGI